MSSRRKTLNTYSTMSQEDVRNSLRNFYGIQLDEHQKKFRDSIWSESKLITFCNACSGSGKTTVALGTACLLYYSGRYSRIIYVISPTMEQKTGYLPGNVEEKAAPYLEPLNCTLTTLGMNPVSVITQEEYSNKDGNAFIRAIPHTYLRGITFPDNSIIILDESQNFYISEIKKVLTRINDTCKVIVIGHTGQLDLFKNPSNSGFLPAINLFKSKEDARVDFCELKINHRGWISTVADELESEIAI